MATDKNFQISTAIDYPSSTFHLGHAYEKICTDVLARWKRLKGFRVHFSTGTDCHGLKIQRAAEKAGKTPLEFVKEISGQFKELSKALNISYDDFIMTIEQRHKKVAQNILNELHNKGEIYKGFYDGLYCVDCETYYTEKDLVEGNCPIHKKPVEQVKEEGYFFKLSKYRKFLINYIKKNPNSIWPEKKRKEILNRLKEPLRDLNISRKNVRWGIPLSFDKSLTEFVWFEALNNYLTTVDYPNKKFKDFWPAIHFIGSDIVWHHTVLWFSILRALNLDIPKVVVHGFINLEGEKLSKARGITINPLELSKKYSSDSLRYFLLRHIPFGEDGDFSEKALIERHNSELANKLGNLVSRAAGLIEKFGVERTSGKLIKKLDEKKIERLIKGFQFDKALNEIFGFIDVCNEYVQSKKPWETQDKKALYELKESILKISELLWPFIPGTSEKIKKQFSAKKIKKGEVLFKKI
jgi:methionyl-tRNA synthetase